MSYEALVRRMSFDEDRSNHGRFTGRAKFLKHPETLGVANEFTGCSKSLQIHGSLQVLAAIMVDSQIYQM